MKVVLVLVVLMLFVCPASASPSKCGVSERVVLDNATDTAVWHTFTRGAHEGFVVVQPGQIVTVDIVWCE